MKFPNSRFANCMFKIPNFFTDGELKANKYMTSQTCIVPSRTVCFSGGRLI